MKKLFKKYPSSQSAANLRLFINFFKKNVPSKNTFSKSLPQKIYFQNCYLKKYLFKIAPSKNTFSKSLSQILESKFPKYIFKKYKIASSKKNIFKISPSKNTFSKLLPQKIHFFKINISKKTLLKFFLKKH